MGEEVVLVRVFGSDMATLGCCSGPSCCGKGDAVADTRPMVEQVSDLGAVLARYYGSGVRVEYVDIFKDDVVAYPGLLDLLSRQLPLPLVTVNGDLRCAGGLPLEGISAAVEALGLVPVTPEESQG